MSMTENRINEPAAVKELTEIVFLERKSARNQTIAIRAKIGG